VRKDPSLTEEQLIEFLRMELTGYKVPRRVYFRDELPKSNVGKILRRELKAQLQAVSLFSAAPRALQGAARHEMRGDVIICARRAIDALENHLLRPLCADPAHDGDPLALLEILVVLEEVRNLVDQRDGQVFV
jgi:hypothetical protein